MGNDQTNEEDSLKETNRVHSINESNYRINRKNEIYNSHKPVIFEDVDKIRKCICKIKIKYDSKESFGTGFFIDYNSFKYLITNYHIISKIIKNIEIEIWDKTLIKFNLNNRYIIYLPKPKDISIIRIDPNEIKNIQYLFIDLNYSRGYHFYKNNEVFTASYPKGKKLATGSGIIKGIIKNGYEFYHNIPTEVGSSGSPIILFNTLTVIGIHKEADIDNKLNIGTFIGEVIKEINYKENNIKNINLIENEAKENTINKSHNRNKENNNEDNEDNEDEDTIKEEIEHINKQFEGYVVIKSLGYFNYLVIKKGKNELFVAEIYKKSIVGEYFYSYNQILNLLRHPYILKIEEIKYTKDYFCIIKPYIEHYMTLLDCLEKYEGKYKRPFEEDIIQHIMRQLVDVIKYIHGFNIIHRNLKPSKIIVFFENEKDRSDLNMIKATIKIQDFFWLFN